MSFEPQPEDGSLLPMSYPGSCLDPDPTQPDPSHNWSGEQWRDFFTWNSKTTATLDAPGNSSHEGLSSATSAATTSTEIIADGSHWDHRLEREGENPSVTHIAMVKMPRLIMPTKHVLLPEDSEEETEEDSKIKLGFDRLRPYFYQTAPKSTPGPVSQLVQGETWGLSDLLRMLQSARGKAWLERFGDGVVDLPSLQSLYTLMTKSEFLDFLPAGARSWFWHCIHLTMRRVFYARPCEESVSRCLYYTIPGVIAAWEAEQGDPDGEPAQVLLALSHDDPTLINNAALLEYWFENYL